MVSGGWSFDAWSFFPPPEHATRSTQHATQFYYQRTATIEPQPSRDSVTYRRIDTLLLFSEKPATNPFSPNIHEPFVIFQKTSFFTLIQKLFLELNFSPVFCPALAFRYSPAVHSPASCFFPLSALFRAFCGQKSLTPLLFADRFPRSLALHIPLTSIPLIPPVLFQRHSAWSAGKKISPQIPHNHSPSHSLTGSLAYRLTLRLPHFPIDCNSIKGDLVN